MSRLAAVPGVVSSRWRWLRRWWRVVVGPGEAEMRPGMERDVERWMEERFGPEPPDAAAVEREREAQSVAAREDRMARADASLLADGPSWRGRMARYASTTHAWPKSSPVRGAVERGRQRYNAGEMFLNPTDEEIAMGESESGGVVGPITASEVEASSKAHGDRSAARARAGTEALGAIVDMGNKLAGKRRMKTIPITLDCQHSESTGEAVACEIRIPPGYEFEWGPGDVPRLKPEGVMARLQRARRDWEAVTGLRPEFLVMPHAAAHALMRETYHLPGCSSHDDLRSTDDICKTGGLIMDGLPVFLGTHYGCGSFMTDG